MSASETFVFAVDHHGTFTINPLTYKDGSILDISIPSMEYEDLLTYLTRKIYKPFTTHTTHCQKNHTISGLKEIRNEYDTNVMFDIAKEAGKLHIYVKHHPIDLSTVLIPNDGSLEESFAGIISEETTKKLEDSLSYLHQMQKNKNKNFDYFEYMVELGFIDKTVPNKPYTQTIFNFLVHNSGQLVIYEKEDTIYINGGTMNITIPRMKLEELKQYFLNIIGEKINALYYTVPHNGLSITVKLRNNYDMHVMFDICAARGNLQIYIDHIGVSFIIDKYIYPNKDLAHMMNHVITDYTSDNEEEINEVSQNDYTVDQMIEWAEPEHFEDVVIKQVIKKAGKHGCPILQRSDYA